MCGLSGTFSFSDSSPVRRDELIAMRDAMAHRGPDGEGVWIDPRGQLGLAHRRLSIQDLGPFAGQPMMNVSADVVVVFNGEIYNHLELRSELIAHGHVFRSLNSDTEVLVVGFKNWGWAGLLQRIRGMYAIALWDVRARCLYLCRDRLGIKPLYLQKVQGRLHFASEIKSILKVSTEPREVDTFALYHYLSGMVTPAPMTMFRGIQKLPAGCYLQIGEDGEVSFNRYWYPTSGQEKISLKTRDDAVDYIRLAFSGAVAEQSVADVPVGIFLSGGIDSTAILASLTRQGQSGVNTYSVGYSDCPELDERQSARDIAEYFCSSHHEIVVSESDLRSSWDKIVEHQDEPIADWVCFPLFHLARAAAQDVKVCLVGEGSDELFAGYDGYLRYLNLYRNLWLPYQSLCPTWLREYVARIAEKAAKGRINHLAGIDFLIRASRGRACFWGGAATFWETQKKNLFIENSSFWADVAPSAGMLDDEFQRVKDSNVMIAAAANTKGLSSELSRMLNLEFAYRLPELLLMRVDKMTMAHSLEARVPFLDHRLVEAVFDLPMEWKIHDHRPKSLFKDAVRGLVPDAVIDRPKRGFGAPISKWLRGPLGKLMEDEIFNCELVARGWFNAAYIRKMFDVHRSGSGDFGTSLWTLYNLAYWHRRWIVG